MSAGASGYRVECGEELFEGAQAKIFQFVGLYSLSGAPISFATDGAGLCVKVMESTDAYPHICDLGQCVSREELLQTATAAQESATLNHANLIPYLIVDLNPSKTCLKMVMPMYAGDLLKWTAGRGHEVSERALLCIGAQLASALDYLHGRGVWHLDLSLRNVLVDNLMSETPHCVLIDMETSTLAGRAPSPHFTYEFSAPERGTKPSEKCDVWSLGMLLFACGARHDTPGVVDDVPGLGCVTMNQAQLTPARIAAVVRRDLRHCESLVSLVTMMLNHDPSTRPPMSYVLGNIQAIQASGGSAMLRFPYVCGPFDLAPLADPDRLSVQLHRRSNMYDLHAPCVRCGQVRSRGKDDRTDCLADASMHLPGHTSPWFAWTRVVPSAPLRRGPDSGDQPLQWPATELEVQALGESFQRSLSAAVASSAAGALPPRTPSAFPIGVYFLYPLLSDRGSGSSSPAAFLAAAGAGRGGERVLLLQTHGGFALFAAEDGASQVPAAVRVLLPMSSTVGAPPPGVLRLCFTAAQPWPSECTQLLSRAGRIHTEVPAMLGTAKCFCWLSPGETFTLQNKEQWTPAPDGGFVFWFGSDPLVPSELDRYFAVVPPVGPRMPPLRFPDPSALKDAAIAVGRTARDFGEAIGQVTRYLVDKTLKSPHHAAPSPLPPAAPPGAVAVLPPSAAAAPPPVPAVEAPTIRVWHCVFLNPCADPLRLHYNFNAHTFELRSTGERGTCSGPFYVSPARQQQVIPAFLRPRVKYIVFARCNDDVFSSLPPAAQTPPAATRVMPHHGFLYLDVVYSVVALVPLWFSSSRAAPPPPPLFASANPPLGGAAAPGQWTPLPLVPHPSATAVYDGALPPGLLSASDMVPVLKPLLRVPPLGGWVDVGREPESRQPTEEEVDAGPSSPSLAYVGWHPRYGGLLLSDESKSLWVLLRLFDVHDGSWVNRH